MDLGNILTESLEYARDTVWEQYKRWILLVISTIIFPFMLGYVMEIYRGRTTPPELTEWGKLFVDGLKFILAGIIWALPVIIIALLSIGPALLLIIEKSASTKGDLSLEVIVPYLVPMILGIGIAVIVGIIISIFSIIGIIRMAREDQFTEAFNLNAIRGTIRTIGWINYIIALIVIWIAGLILGIIVNLIMVIPLIGWLIGIFLMPLIQIFQARYMTIIYEEGIIVEKDFMGYQIY